MGMNTDHCTQKTDNLMAAATRTNYNEVLFQISSNLSNTLNTFGPSSAQYQVNLDILRSCLRDVGASPEQRRDCGGEVLDPDVLGLALGFLEIGGGGK